MKALYGFRRSPRLYYNWIKGELVSRGYEEVAQCIFIMRRDKSVSQIVVVYVDDLLMFSKNPTRDLIDLPYKMSTLLSTK